MSKSDDSRIHRRLTLNSISNLSRYVISIAIAFFLTPFIVRTLGDSLYGFWILLMSFIGYAGILEMGVQPAVVKLVGQYRAVGNQDKLRELVSAAFAFFIFVGVIAAVLVLTVVPAVVRRHVDGLTDLPHPGWVFPMIAVDAMIMYMNYLLTGILYGAQRYHMRNVIDVGAWILNAAMVLTLLEAGGIVALVACKLVMDLVTVLGSLVVVRRVFPELTVGWSKLRRESFREVMSFGGQVFISATMARIANNAQPIIISTTLSAAATSFYAIPVRLVGYTQQAAWTITAGFMPMFSELESRDEREMLRSIYLNYSRYIFGVLIPIPILLFVYGPAFIGLWIGPEYAERGEAVLHLLAAAVLIESFQPLLWRFFIGVGHLGVVVKVSAAMSALIVVLSIVMVRVMGIAGVAFAVLVGAILAQTVYTLQACRYFEISLFAVLAQVHVRPLVVGALTYGFAVLLASVWGKGSYPAIAAGVLLSLILHVGLGLRVAVTRDERRVVFRKASSWLGRYRRGNRPPQPPEDQA